MLVLKPRWSEFMQPRRSALYMPGANPRAMEKAKTLDCDVVIFDLEDAVAMDAKVTARNQVAEQVRSGGYARRDLVVRVNGLDTPWGVDDVRACAQLPVAALLFPKVASLEYVEQINALLAQENPQMRVWIMIETPAGILDLETFAGHPCVDVLVMGTSDLVRELRADHIEDRSNLTYALQRRSVMVARRFGKDILDGVHLDFRNLKTLRTVCEQGKRMGFDGKLDTPWTRSRQLMKSLVMTRRQRFMLERCWKYGSRRKPGQGVAVRRTIDREPSRSGSGACWRTLTLRPAVNSVGSGVRRLLEYERNRRHRALI